MGNTRSRTVGGMQSRTSAARKPAPKAETPVHEAQVIELAPRVEEVEEVSALEKVLAELGAVDNGRISVHRLPKEGGMQYVCTLTPDEVQGEDSLFEAIRREYGGGDYRIHVRDQAGLLANRRVSIAERKQPADLGGAAPMVAALERMQAQFAQVLQAVTARPAVSDGDAEERVLQRMKMMADIVRPQHGGGNGGEDMRLFMDTFQKGIDLGKAMVAPAEENPAAVLMQSLRTFEPLLRDAAKPPARPARPAAAPAQVQAVPHQVQQQPQPQPVEPVQAGGDAEAMRALLLVVVKGAAANRDPDMYASLLADQLGTQAIEELLSHHDPIGLLLSIAPEAAQHRTWFEALRESLAEVIDDEAEHAEGAELAHGPAGRTGGGHADPGRDAVVGQ